MSDPKSKDPLESLPNIEEGNNGARQLNAQEEIAIIKSGYYSMRASLDLQFEQTVGQLYAQLLEKNQIVSALHAEVMSLKDEKVKLQEEISKIKAVN